MCCFGRFAEPDLVRDNHAVANGGERVSGSVPACTAEHLAM